MVVGSDPCSCTQIGTEKAQSCADCRCTIPNPPPTRGRICEEMGRGFLIVNPRSGGGSPEPAELVAEARRRGIDVHELASGDDPAEIARAADAGALGVAGGDGSLASVAGVALQRDLPFV